MVGARKHIAMHVKFIFRGWSNLINAMCGVIERSALWYVAEHYVLQTATISRSTKIAKLSNYGQNCINNRLDRFHARRIKNNVDEMWSEFQVRFFSKIANNLRERLGNAGNNLKMLFWLIYLTKRSREDASEVFTYLRNVDYLSRRPSRSRASSHPP